jgi:ribosomal protein L16/L10AE
MFEVSGVTREEAQDLLIKASKKLPVKCRVVEKGEIR